MPFVIPDSVLSFHVLFQIHAPTSFVGWPHIHNVKCHPSEMYHTKCQPCTLVLYAKQANLTCLSQVKWQPSKAVARMSHSVLLNLSILPLQAGWYGVVLVLQIPIVLHILSITSDSNCGPWSECRCSMNPFWQKCSSTRFLATIFYFLIRKSICRHMFLITLISIYKRAKEIHCNHLCREPNLNRSSKCSSPQGG